MVTDLSTTVSALEAAAPKLNASDRSFALSLVAFYKKTGGLSPKQLPWVDKLIAKADKPHVDVLKVNVGDFAGVVALFTAAKQHLKYPKIVLSCEGVPIYLSLAGPKSKAPGFINVMGEGKYPNRAWYGRISPFGDWEQSKSGFTLQNELLALLKEFSASPARVAKKYGKLTGNCCFCASQLTDPKSTAAGFGPVCAVHYGLKEEWRTAVKKAEIHNALEQIQKSTGVNFGEITQTLPKNSSSLSDHMDEKCFFCGENYGIQMIDEVIVCASCAKELGK